MLRLTGHYDYIQRHYRQFKLLMAPLLLLLMLGVYLLVYATGGIKYVFSHSMYLPIVLSAFVYGSRGGLLGGLLGGLILGPIMPIDTSTGEMQNTLNWLYRMGFFILIGTVIGLTSDQLRTYIRQSRWADRHDTRTELPNRLAIIESITAIGKTSPDKSATHQLILISLENSKEIENTFGLNAVNAIIVQIKERITPLTPAGRLFRVHSDQLAILCSNMELTPTKKLCTELELRLQEPFHFTQIYLHADIRMGAVSFDQVNHEPSYYIQTADAAVTQARSNNRRAVFFTATEIDSEIADNLALLGNLKNALQQEQLLLEYQPQINIDTGMIEGAEALIRWNHPTLGIIPPDKFIPRAERSTLIDQLTEFAIDRALRQQSAWQKQGINLKVAVNVAATNLSHYGLIWRIQHLLKEYELEPSCLEIEVTESACMENIEQAILVLNALTKIGITLSVDDFGTGYSSLQYLNRLPVSVLKIDQSFVRSALTDPSSQHIVKAVITLGQNLNMRVIAEGVESLELFELLHSLGCDLAQGYFFSPSLSGEALTEKIQANKGCFYQRP